MKLNVGSSDPSGKHREAEWVNIDIHPFQDVIVADPLKGLPFESNYFETIECCHVLEHVEYKDHIPFLTELYRVCQPGGVIFVEVPNLMENCVHLLSVYRDYKSGKLSQDIGDEVLRCLTLSIFGKGRWVGDTHRWGFYPEKLISLVKAAGFKDVVEQKEMISSHYKQEPVILVRGTK